MSGGDDFEARRLQNIERNEQFLKSIGLAEVKSSIENSKLDPDHTLDILDKHTKRRNKKPQSAPAVPRPHLRRSSRGAGGADTSEPDGGSTGSLDGSDSKRRRLRSGNAAVEGDSSDNDEVNKKKISAKQLLKFMEDENTAHAKMISNQALYHCVMRTNDMSVSNLVTRLRRLENKEKLLAFHYGLRLAGLKDLAEVAKQKAIQRSINF